MFANINLVREPEGRLSRGRENNIIMALEETEGGGEDWIHLAQVRTHWWALLNSVINFRIS
jgi:hypothetical protein